MDEEIKEEKTKAKAESEVEKIAAEAKLLGIKSSKVSISGFNVRNITPEKRDKEEAKHRKLAEKRLKGRVAKVKADAKKKPIDKRRELLVGRFKAIRSRVRASTYSDKNIEAWTEEYNLITNNPKQWNRVTKNGKAPYAPGNKRKKTAKELLDTMNLDD